MKLETKKRIEAYQKALPHMKERVTAIALLFVISITMVISATFAWITLSRAPEINGLATTISTNGNLEIALSDIDGLAPDETKIGDGSGNITESNLTWGNLINLADDSYGLSNITLRPAALNTRTLSTSPMYTVNYDADGRVSGYFNDFSYTNYDSARKGFVVNYKTNDDGIKEKLTNYGVRAISTVTFKDLSGDQTKPLLITALDDSIKEVKTDFEGIYDTSTPKGEAYMITVGELVSIHVNWTLEPGQTHTCTAEQIKSLYYLSQDFYALMGDGTNKLSSKDGKGIGEIIVDMANLYLFQEDRERYNTDKYTFEDLISGDLPEEYKGRIDCLEYYVVQTTKSDGVTKDISAWAKTVNACELIEKKYNEVMSREAAGEINVTIPWDADLRKAVNYLCDMNTAELDGNTVGDINAMLANKDIAGLWGVANNKTPAAVIYDGALADASHLLETAMDVASSEYIRIAATVVVDSLGGMEIPINMQPSIATIVDKEKPSLYDSRETVSTFVMSGESNYKGDEAAADTYAMVMDIWVRTNSASSLLVLEGEAKYTQMAGTDADGNSVGLLYRWKTTDENGNDAEVLVYEKDGTYYNDGTSDAVGSTPAKEDLTIVYENKPYAYEGVNRVWEELNEENNIYQPPAGAISTTQGSGSCYIFYPSSPEDQEQSLKLLSAMKVAFVDSDGSLLARAEMRPEIAVENSGRVLVPLVLRPNTPVAVDEIGTTESYYITALAQNEPKRITAIVYLDGTNLSNSDVMSAGSITGQLNIQFGTTDADLSPVEDEKVMRDYYNFEFNTYEKNFADTDTEWDLDLSLTLINGSAPRTIKGTFVSVINSSQGARQPQFEFERQGDTNEWKAMVSFTGPGNYQLKSLQIDGVDYLLDKDKIVRVKVPGNQITSLSWDGDNNKKSVLTADTFYEQSLSLVLNSSKTDHSAVQGVFIGDNGQNVTVNFTTTDGTNYTGTGLFNTSGTYELTYVYVDGVITSLVESNENGEVVKDISKKLTLQLGLTTEVNIYRPILTDGNGNEITDETILKNVTGDIYNGWSFIYTSEKPIFFEVACKLFDDGGKEITGLGNVKLYYQSGGEMNALDSNMTWNEELQKYVGKFVFQGSGNYTFYSVAVTVNGNVNPVTKATISPEITAIPPVPMEYVEQDEYPDVTFEIGAPQNLSVTLKNASAAKLTATLTNTSLSGDVIETKTIDSITAQGTDENTNISEFVIPVAEDGLWTLTELKASQVFYDGTYYPGGDNSLDLTNEVVSDDIGTYFLTDVSVSVSGAPEVEKVYTGTFMADHEVNDMKISVTSGGQHLVKLLKDLNAKYSDANLDETVSVTMTYTWGGGDYVDNVDDANLPTNDFGGTLNAGSDYVFAMGNMNFKLKGTYTPEFGLTVNGSEYKHGSTLVTIPEVVTKAVSVDWTNPTVTISAISPDKTNHHTVYYYYNKWYDQGYKEIDKTSSISSDFHSATVYVEATKATLGTTLVTYPQVTLTLVGMGSAQSAKMDFSENNSGTVHLYTSQNSGRTDLFEWNSNTNGTAQCKRYVGSYDMGALTNITTAGTLSASKVVLVYDGVEYTFDLGYTITINNPNAG